MAKLTFTFGTMGSAKTAYAMMQRFNFIEHGKKVLFLKSSLDTRDGKNIIKSRVGLEIPVIEYSKKDNLVNIFSRGLNKVDYIIIDEIELATPKQVDQLKYIAEELNVPIYAYGLRTDFKTNMFPGSKRMFELADSINQLECICHCGSNAIVNARYDEKGIVYDGKQVEIGGNERYIGLCLSCWKKGNLN